MATLGRIIRDFKKGTAPLRKKLQTKAVKRLMTSDKAYSKGGVAAGMRRFNRGGKV